jgi:hypothetical protein
VTFAAGQITGCPTGCHRSSWGSSNFACDTGRNVEGNHGFYLSNINEGWNLSTPIVQDGASQKLKNAIVSKRSRLTRLHT